MKYEKMENSYYQNGNTGKNIEEMLVPGESILWKGKPKKSAYILGRILPMAPVALLWIGFDSIFIGVAIFMDMPWFVRLFMGIFLVIHLLPFWSWLAELLTANKRYKNMEYAVTDRRILIKSGLVGIDYETINYKDIDTVDLKVGVFDRILHVGDIYLSTKNSKSRHAIFDISDCYNVYSKIQKIILDIQTDIEYPNALRPDNNPGYNTKYNNKE